MSNVSAVDQLRVALNMTLSSHLEPLRAALIEQSVAAVSNFHEALIQFTRDDLESMPTQSVPWVREQFMQHDNLPFETWSALLLYQPERPRKVKAPQESGFSQWAKTHDGGKTHTPAVVEKSSAAWESFLLVEKLFGSAPGHWLTKSSTLSVTRDTSKSMVSAILKQLSPKTLTPAEQTRVCTTLLNLPTLLFPPAALESLWEGVSFEWLSTLTVHAQTHNTGVVGEWEKRSVQTALKKLDKYPRESLQLLTNVLDNFATQPSNLDVRAPNNPKVFSHYKNVLEIVDAKLQWNEEDKLRFIPNGDDFLKIVRKRIVPNGNISELVEDLFSYPMDRLPNTEQITKEFAHRFQVFMFFSVFANNKSDLDNIVSVVQKIPAHILQATKTTTPAAIDLKTVETVLLPNSYGKKASLKATIAKILSSKKRKDERHVAARQSVMQRLPSDLANSAQLLLHWADPEQYSAPENGVTSLAVNKRAKDVDSADVAELRSLFLKHNLLHELGGQEDVAVRVARKM